MHPSRSLRRDPRAHLAHRSRRRIAAMAAAVALLVPAAACTGDDGAGPADPTTGATSPPDHPTRAERRAAWADPTLTGWGPTVGELAKAHDLVARLSDRELVGRLFVAGFTGTRAPIDLVRRLDLGGVIVGSTNGSDPAAVGRLIGRLQRSVDRPWPLVVSVDQEGGTVARIGAPLTQFPTFMGYGAAGRPGLAGKASAAMGRELRAIGFTMVYAPDADVTIGAADPTIRSRSAGDDPGQVAAIVRASVRGFRDAGIVPVLKHFPGHGSVTVNSHRGLPHQDASLRTLEARDLRPFEAGIAAHAPVVMLGHIALDRLDPGIPADLSPAAVALLRDHLGFEGVVTTDALDMAAVTQRFGPGEAAVRALRAGVDQLLMPPEPGRAVRAVRAALASGRLSREALEDSAARIGALMLHEAAQPRPPTDVIGSGARLSRTVSQAALTVVTGACQGPYVGASVRPVGEDYLVAAFEQAAARAGLEVRRHGTTVALMGERPPRARVDVAVAVSAPFALAKARAGTRLALFGWTPEAMDALVAALTGRVAPPGSLPVEVPGLRVSDCRAGGARTAALHAL